jgi:hypothetical protein
MTEINPRNKMAIGVDPGKTGAIVAVSESGVDGSKKRHVDFVFDNKKLRSDLGAMLRMRGEIFVESYDIDISIVIERQQYMPRGGVRQGGKSAFTLGEDYGYWKGLFDGLNLDGVTIKTIAPQLWQTYIYNGAHEGDTKEASIATARLLLPDLELVPKGCRNPSHGRSDAGLLAVYGLEVLLARPRASR